MTIHTKDDRPAVKPEIEIQLPVARTTQPGVGVVATSSEPDLEAQIKVRRAELIERLRELKTDTRLEAIAAGDKLKAKLSEVAHIIKEGVVDGWTTLGDTVKHKLQRWLTDSAGQQPTSNTPATAGQS